MRKTSWILLCLLCALLAAGGAATGQEDTIHYGPGERIMIAHVFRPLFTFNATANLVQIPVSVRDGGGKLVADLTAADFKLTDKGHVETITGFALDHRGVLQAGSTETTQSGSPSPAPSIQTRYLALFIDDFHFNPRTVRFQSAMRQYIEGGLPAGTRVAVFSASGSEQLDFTSNPRAVMAAIARIPQYYPPLMPPIDSEAFVEALQSVARYFEGRPGDKQIVVLSFGFYLQPGTWGSVETLATTALHAGVTISGVDPRGVGRVPGMVPLDDVIAEIAQKTGGDMTGNNNDLLKIISDAANGPEVSYLLSYKPTESGQDGKYHGVSVKVARQGRFDVEAKPGYYAPEPPGTIDQYTSLQDKIIAAALDSREKASIPATIVVQSGQTDDGSPAAHIVVEVPAKALSFVSASNGRKIERINFAAVLNDSTGHYVTGQQGKLILSLTKLTFEELQKVGVRAGMTLKVPPGTYQLREIVAEENKGAMATYNRTVTVAAPAVAGGN